MHFERAIILQLKIHIAIKDNMHYAHLLTYLLAYSTVSYIIFLGTYTTDLLAVNAACSFDIM